jgi:hypothetical protein
MATATPSDDRARCGLRRRCWASVETSLQASQAGWVACWAPAPMPARRGTTAKGRTVRHQPGPTGSRRGQISQHLPGALLRLCEWIRSWWPLLPVGRARALIAAPENLPRRVRGRCPATGTSVAGSDTPGGRGPLVSEPPTPAFAWSGRGLTPANRSPHRRCDFTAEGAPLALEDARASIRFPCQAASWSCQLVRINARTTALPDDPYRRVAGRSPWWLLATALARR